MEHLKDFVQRIARIWHKPTRRNLGIALLAFVGIIVIVQVLYPDDRTLPLATIDTQDVGGWLKKDAAWQLANEINDQQVAVYRGDEGGVYSHANLATLGVNTDTHTAIDAIDYPWYMRLVPTSLLWYGATQNISNYTYRYDDTAIGAFIKKDLADCNLAPQNASLTAQNGILNLISAKNGGICEPDEVKSAIKQLKPTSKSSLELRFAATITPPTISDADARKTKTLLEKTDSDILLQAREKTLSLPRKTALSWLIFDNSAKALTYTIDKKQSGSYFTKNVTPNVAAPAGVTKVTTRDFTETSRVLGKTGRALDADPTRQSVIDVLSGKSAKATAATKQVAPSVSYVRTYSSSDVGLSALLQQYAQDNKGTFGVQYIELDGKKRRADYNASKQFITASTYKLFVAYSTLKRVESGKWKWSDQVTGGQELTTCFDKMIVNSDNACAEALYGKIGYQTVINEARSLGLSQTILDKEGQKTSAGDLGIFLGSLYSGTIDLNTSSRTRLISAMKRNVYRQGVPAGSSGTVADKVGFLNGLLHDASIVYSKQGDYVLVVMTDGSSWGKIAELTRKIESIR